MRGRKRRPGYREPSGRHQRTAERDRGTKESQAYRKYLASGQDGADPNQTSYPLGVLLTNGIVTQDQHDAGCKYAWLYCAINGRRSLAGQTYDSFPKGKADPDWPPDWADGEFRIQRAFVEKLGRFTKDTIDNACVFEHQIRWLLPLRPTVADLRHADALVDGLQSLAQFTVFGN